MLADLHHSTPQKMRSLHQPSHQACRPFTQSLRPPPAAAALPRQAHPGRARSATRHSATRPGCQSTQQQRRQQQQQHAGSDQSGSSSSSRWPGGEQLPAAALAALLAGQVLAAEPCWAVLNSPNARIPRNVEAALRRSIPAFNQEIGQVQKTLEDIAYLLRIPQRKPWGNMAADVAAALAAFDNRPALLAGVPPSQLAEGEALLDGLYAKLKQLELAVKTQQPDFTGVRVADALKRVAELELLQAPGLAFSIPREYAGLPRLVGRATVELLMEKADGSLAFVDTVNGGLSKTGKVVITLDGYSAPISAGNFVVNVLDGLYSNRPVAASYASVITAAPLTSPRPPIPLENRPAGAFDPLYRFPLDVQSGELPVLPLSIAGAVSMTHLPDTESFLSGDEWFIFKFDKQQAGLSGLSFDEGTFGVFGYVTEGMDTVVPKLGSGDVIVSAKVTSGLERLVRPQQPAPQP